MHHLFHLGQFLSRRLVHVGHLSGEVQRLARQRVIEVHHYDVVLHLQHGAVHVLPLGAHHGQRGAFLHALAIEHTVYHEDTLRQIDHILLYTLAVCLLRSKGKLEAVARFQTAQILFEGL